MKKFINLIAILILSCSGVFSQWQQITATPQGSGVTDMVVANDGTLIVTTASYNWPNGQPGGIRRSTNGGNSWQNIMNIYNSRTLYLGSSGRLFASCWVFPANEGMFYSTNNGLNWTQSFFGAANDNVFSIAAKNGDSMVFIGTRNGVYRSFNNGSWIQLTFGMEPNSWVRDLAIDSNGVIAAGTTNGLYISTNHGNQWQQVSGISSDDTITSVIFDYDVPVDNSGAGARLIAGSSDGDMCQAFSSSGYTTATLLAIFYEGEISKIYQNKLGAENVKTHGVSIFAHGPLPGGIKISTDNGVTWVSNNNGLPPVRPVSALVFTPLGSFNAAFAGFFQNISSGSVIYKLLMPIGISQISSEVPNGYALSQNYPNPFNPVTNIEFAIPRSSFVKLIVYDMLGNELESLVSKELKVGTYKTDWNASKYSSGVYFYKLITDGMTETKKMMLVK